MNRIQKVAYSLLARMFSLDSILRENIVLRAINRVISAANQAPDIMSLHEEILTEVLKFTSYDAGCIYLMDSDKNKAEVAYSINLPPDFTRKISAVQAKQDRYNPAFETCEPAITTSRDTSLPGLVFPAGFCSKIDVPLVSQGGIIGSLILYSKQYHDISRDEKTVLSSIGKEFGSIIKRIKAEENVQVAARNFRKLFNTIDELVFILDLRGTIIRVNDTVTKRLLVSNEELEGKNILALHSDEQREEALAIMYQIAAGEINSFSLPLQSKNGGYIEVETKITRGWWDGAEVLIGISRDISKRKEAEDALRKSEENFFKAFHSGPTPTIISDIDTGIYIEVNNQYCKTIGFSREELIGHSPLECGILIQSEPRAQYIEKIKEDGTLKDVNIKIRTRQGVVIDAIWSAEIITIDGREAMISSLVDITERNKTEQALKEAERRFRDLFNLSSDGLLGALIDDHKLSTTNSKMCEMLGYTREELLEKHIEDIHPEERLLYVFECFDKLRRKEICFARDIPLKKRNGDVVYTDVSASIISFDGRAHILCSYRDMTERRQVEEDLTRARQRAEESREELKKKNEEYEAINDVLTTRNQELLEAKIQSEENYKLIRDIADASPLAIYISNKNNKEENYINPTFQNLFGYSIEEISTSNDWFKLTYPDTNYREAIYAEWRKKTRKGVVISSNLEPLETVVRCKDGSDKVVRWGFVSTSYKNWAFGLDITDSKKIEDELKKAKDRAEESEAKYKQIFDNTQDHIFVLDVTEKHRYKVLVVNPMHKREINALDQGKYIDECFPPDLCKRVEKNYTRCVNERGIFSYEETLYDYTFYTQLIPIKDNNGTVTRIIGISRNITNEKKLNNQLIEHLDALKSLNRELTSAKEKAEESNRLKTAFLQNISHEVRTPMNAIIGFSELLVRNHSDKQKLEHFSTIISHSCNDLLVIINDILDIAKIESGQLSITIERCDLDVLFDELRQFFTAQQAKLDKQHIQFTITAQCGHGRQIIATDKIKLKQVFVNLIGNAFKFTTKGKIDCGCVVDDNDNLMFFVADTGIGIPREKRKVIFERFIQADQGANRLYGGTGLGLSIVKGIVKLLGGNIWVESEEGKGSTFYFILSPAPTQLSDIKQLETGDVANKRVLPKKTILVVEDDIYNATLITEVLAETGLHIITARNGIDAVDIAKYQLVDLILMDIGLPDISGYDAIMQIKQIKPQLRIIVQTAYTSLDDKQKAMDAGCIDTISKPLDIKHLLSMVDKYLS